MGDPAAPYPERRSQPEGVGPYRTGDDFPQIGALAAGETYRLDLREHKRGRYTALSPKGYDTVTVDNVDDNPLTVTLNETNRMPVPGDTSRSFNHAGTYVIEVTNDGTDALAAAGNVTVAVQEEPLGADEQARRQARQGALASVVENFTGLPVGRR